MFSNGAGQLIALLITPLLTRFYDAQDFGVWATFMAISSFIIVGSALRYDVSILLPDNRRDVFRLSVISVKNILVTVTVILVLLGFYFEANGGVILSFYLIPLSILFAGISLVLTANLNYKKMYKSMAVCTFIQTLSTLLFNLVFYKYSVIDAVGIELILSSILGQFSRMISELLFLRIGLRGVFFAFRQKYSVRLARKYYDFAVYSLPACFITSLQAGLPVYVLGFLFSDESVGQYALANRVLMVPLAVVGTALSQVLLKHFSEKLNSGENILGTLYRVWGISLSVVLIPAVMLFLSAEAIVSFIFGAQWVTAGQIISILIFPVLINFSLNITSASHVVLRMQDIAFYFSIAMLAAKLILTLQLSADYFMLLLAYSLVDMAGIVLINLMLIYRLKKAVNENINVA